MPKTNETVFTAGLPWLEPDDDGIFTEELILRNFVTVPAGVSRVYCDESRDPLPQVSNWRGKDGRFWCKYELPRGEGSQSSTKVTLSKEIESKDSYCDVRLGSGISRSLLDELLDETENEPTFDLQEYGRIRDLVDSHNEFVNDLSDRIKPKRIYWEGNHGGHAIRSLFRTTYKWIRSDDRDDARLALIVKLAREISRILGYVCDNPRVVLRRSREFQKISKIQEVDAACLRWLARQPGRDVYERAGSRQQLLGVVRIEDTDTLENRVVKDFLHRARVECSNYISLYREFRNHDRVRAVDQFRRQITDWTRNSSIMSAKRLVGTAQPNYVLLHEPKYRKLWEAYQLLLSQQKQKDEIWKWRDRTFSECCEIAIWSVIQKQSSRSSYSKSDVVFELEAVAGQFVSNATQLGSAIVQSEGGNVRVFVIRGNQASRCPFIPRKFYPLTADFFVVTFDENGEAKMIMPVWCFVKQPKADFEIQHGLSILEKKLDQMPKSAFIHPLILTFNSNQTDKPFFNSLGCILDLQLPISASMKKLEAFISRGIDND